MPDPRVGAIRSTSDDRNNFAGIGFVVYGNDGRPAAVFGFLTEAEAKLAAKKMSENNRDVRVGF
jgi:hypothetical protein